MQATLTKWGNSQGLRIPVEACEALGISVGAHAEMQLDPANATLTLRFERPERQYARHRKMSLEEFASGWSGGKVGEEWGGCDVGAEVVE